MFKPTKKTLVTAITFLLIGIIGTSVVWVYAQPSNPFYISGGVYPSASSVTFAKEGSTYYAKNGFGRIIYENTNATTLINNGFSSAGIGGQIFFKQGKYSIDGVITPLFEQRIEGEAKAKHEDYASSTILELTTASATLNLKAIEGIQLSSLTIDGNNIAIGITTGDSVTIKSAGYVFDNMELRNCTYGIYNDDTTGFYDSAFYSCKFFANDVGVQLKELMNNFYQCTFSRNKVGVEYGVSTTGHWGLFEGCVWSGNNYDFNLTSLNPSITVKHSWFESEGLHSLGIGNGDVFTNTSGLSTGTKGVIFEHCYFSEYTNIDLSWADYGGHILRGVVFRECNFQGWDDLSMLTLKNSAYYPRFENSWRANTTGFIIWLLTENEGAISIADGATIEHGLVYTPSSVDVTTSVSGEFASVTAIGTTTFTVAIKKHDNSAGTTQTIYWMAIHDPLLV